MAKLSPIFNEQVLDANGAPASGWQLYTYAAGSSTLQTAYTDSAGSVPQANPITLQTDGRCPDPIWLTEGQNYKFILKDDSGVTQYTVDNVAGVNDTTVSVSQWQSTGVTPTYVSPTSFTLVGDQTSEFHVGRRVQATVTGGTVYGAIQTSAYTTLTTVTVALDSGALDAGLSAVNLSILRADHPALPKSGAVLASIGAAASGANSDITSLTGITGEVRLADAVSVASATTCDIGAANSNNVTITGTTTITGLGTIAAGAMRFVTFSGALTLTHNATSLILPGTANIATAAGDTASFLSLGSGNWRCLSYQRASGSDLYPLTAGTAQNTTSGTALDFTGIPSWVKQIRVSFETVSTNGSSNLMLEIGTASGVENSGYSAWAWQGGSGDSVATATNGFVVTAVVSAANSYTGSIVLTKLSGNKWIASGIAIRNDGAGVASGGVKSLAGTLDRVRITTAGGTDSFDSGSINILYE
jgi:hypothetical protein